MEELNELNDIILNKSGLKSGRQKWLLIILLLTLILVAIVVGMRSLKSDDIQKVLQSVLPPEPNAPTEVINDPIVEPVKGAEKNTDSTLTPMDNEPKEVIQAAPTEVIPAIQEKTISPSAPKEVLEETPTKTIIQPAPVAKAPEKKSDSDKKTAQANAIVEKKPHVIAEKPKKEENKKEPTKKEEPKKEAKPIVQPKKVTSEVKAPGVVKKVSEPKPPLTPKATPKEATVGDTTTYYIQVGSFSKEPNPTLINHLNASGLKYTTRKVGDMTKLLVGPYQGEQAAKEGLANVRKNIEAQAFRVK
ncbi:MAG: SPOR domain-containing protein [Sulfuricurvum sp.]